MALSACGGDESGGETVTPPLPPPVIDIAIEPWSFDGSNGDLVSAAQVSGLYAAADSSGDLIEIRDIHETVLHEISVGELSSVLPDFSFSGENGICGMTLTPSGRFLYIAACMEGESDNKDAIVAYNTNTRELTLLDRVTLVTDEVRPVGMTYFKGQLYVGGDAGIHRYDATRNRVFDVRNNNLDVTGQLVATQQPVTGLAVDMVDEKIYFTTQGSLNRMQPDGFGMTTLSSGVGFDRVTMGAVYGNDDSDGLFLLKHIADGSRILKIPSEALRAGQPVSPEVYAELDYTVDDISATADGRMMLAAQQIQMMRDNTDPRLSYQDWLQDELHQYYLAIKSLVEDGSIEGTSTLLGRPGFLLSKIVQEGGSPDKSPVADNVGWALFLLMAIDQVQPNPEIERLVELLIERHAGLYSDGYGGVRTVDGHFVRMYGSDGLPKTGGPEKSQPQVYVSMKFLPAAYKAAEMYPHNERLQTYKEYLRQLLQRSSDTIRANQKITWTNDDYGPLLNNNAMSNETWLFGDIGAAQDPLATEDYAHYVYDRRNFVYDHWLKGEAVIRAGHSAFIVMGGTLILKHHAEDAGWAAFNRNYYAATMAETDDMGAPYFGGFSAGNQPTCPTGNEDWCGGYHADGPSDHPNDIIHFPAVLGFGQHGHTPAVVGAYMAYRDGKRQPMNNAAGGEPINMLTRWSMAEPDYTMKAVGIADFWFGGVGLVEAIQPGTVDRFRAEFYRPDLEVERSNGQTTLHYSNITPRKVIGHDGQKETHYGYQMSPFNLPAGISHQDYEIIDPEGEWLELEDLVSELDGKSKRFSNPGFENGLDSWTTNGDVTVVDSETGSAAQVSGVGALGQPLELSMDLPGTRYRISSTSEMKQGSGKGYIRLQWRASEDILDPVLEEAVSNEITSVGSGQALSVVTEKPAGAGYLHINYVTEGADSVFLFDNTAAVRQGADSPLENGDFAGGENGWDVRSGSKLVDNPNGVDGKALLMKRSVGQSGATNVFRNEDVSLDPLGTRYLYRFDVTTEGSDEFIFEVDVEVLDAAGQRIILRENAGDVLPGQKGEVTFVMRKRPGDHTHRINFQMTRDGEKDFRDASVFIDNFHLDKQKLFDESACVSDSPTGCLPTRVQ